MSNVVNFSKRHDSLEFTSPIIGDGYLEMTAINALQALEYDLNKESVMAFQKEAELEETGVIDTETFLKLILVFEPDNRQYILNELRTAQYKEKAIKENDDIEEKPKKKKQKKELDEIFMEFIVWVMIIVIIIALFMGLRDLWHFIYKVFNQIMS